MEMMRNNQYNNLTIEQFNNRKGITLIEMIAVIVVVGLAIPAILLMWQDLSFRSGRAEVIAQASFYAQELMEEIKSKKFDENDTSPWTPSANFGPDGETYPNYDDVDDFHNSSSPFDYCDNQGVCDDDSNRSYQRWVTVEYVVLNTGTDPDSWEASGSTTDYKRIRVLASHRFGDSSLVTIVSGY
jgi:type II secretory pathway pseudopilin PulG